MDVLNFVAVIVLSLCALLLLFFHISSPLIVRKTERLPETYRFNATPAFETDLVRSLKFQLSTLGFEYIGSSELRDSISDTHFSLFREKEGTLSATVVTVQNPLDHFTYLEFMQLYQDGTVVSVSNAPVCSVYPTMDKRITLRLPKVQNSETLLKVVELAKFHSSLNAPAVPLRDGTEFAQVAATLNDELQQLINRGYVASDARNGQRSLTLKGALLFAWKSLWPWRYFRQRLEEKQTKTFLFACKHQRLQK